VVPGDEPAEAEVPPPDGGARELVAALRQAYTELVSWRDVDGNLIECVDAYLASHPAQEPALVDAACHLHGGHLDSDWAQCNGQWQLLVAPCDACRQQWAATAARDKAQGETP
jgi:hypothetical protein